MTPKRERPILYIGWDVQPHNYIAGFIRYVRRRSLGNRDRHFKISHDDWFAFFKGRACNCDPEVRDLLGGSGIGT